MVLANRLFLNFLKEHAPKADAVYILGDLFEVWLGDDMILPDYHPAIAQIAETVKNGTPVYVMYGNRDFLMKEDFEKVYFKVKITGNEKLLKVVLPKGI